MKRILLRSGKNPFDYISPEATLTRNLLGTNSGNLIFAHSVYKTINTSGVEIISAGYTAKDLNAEKINSEFSSFIIPLANAFRTSFIPHLDKYSDLIEKLNIPVVVPGVGIQATLDYDSEDLLPYKDNIYRFIKAVLKNSSSIGVRGECTYEFIRSLGFKDEEVDIIGCPSMFLHGNKFNVREKLTNLNPHSNICINISPYAHGIEQICAQNLKDFKNLVYIPQNNDSLQQLLWGYPFSISDKAIPHNVTHPLYLNDRIRFFVDPWTWLDYLSKFDFTFGTRIHGNIMSLLAGTPAHVIAHDSRTLELARYFEIPHSRIDTVYQKASAYHLYEQSDFTKLQSGHSDRFENYTKFLEKNNIKHVYQKNEDCGKAFEERLEKSHFCPAVTTPYGSKPQDLISRMGSLKHSIELRKKEVDVINKMIHKEKENVKVLRGMLGDFKRRQKRSLYIIVILIILSLVLAIKK